MKKRVLSALLVFALMVSCLPAQAFAADAPSSASQQTSTDTLTTESGAQSDGQDMSQSGVQDNAQSGVQSGVQDSVQSDVQPAPFTGGITYLDASGNPQTYDGEYTSLTGEITELKDGWYLAEGAVSVSQRINVSGNVTLVLADGADLTVTGGIRVASGNSLTITAQSNNQDTGFSPATAAAGPRAARTG